MTTARSLQQRQRRCSAERDPEDGPLDQRHQGRQAAHFLPKIDKVVQNKPRRRCRKAAITRIQRLVSSPSTSVYRRARPPYPSTPSRARSPGVDIARADIIKCQTKPLTSEYAVTSRRQHSGGEIAGGVPSGVCDWSKRWLRAAGPPARHLAGHRLKDGRNANGTRDSKQRSVSQENRQNAIHLVTRSFMS